MSTDASSPASVSLAVCPQCCHANPPQHHFCESCNMPLSSMAAILPAWRPWAEGYLVRRAVRRVDSWFVLIGMWLLFAPPIFAITQTSIWEQVRYNWSYGSRTSAIVDGLIFVVFGGGALLFSAAILFLTTRSFFRNHRQERLTESQE